ncbi:hypothetical protein Tsubulata_028771 [Turnera subulata]|uniref:Photosynthetic NDH subunit of lumenal location 2, chloroplastic n=1 Tax=Turnera subulata TaxID=218843 RepID=A0A9Q0GBF5_9ROSI|nr:hypothetical protein Tsubulata_028771 [Turnera subulata]
MMTMATTNAPAVTILHPPIKASSISPSPPQQNVMTTNRRNLFQKALVILATTTSLGVGTPVALAQNWGTHSFIKEYYFMPDLSPEDSAARIRQTAEGLHSIRDMLESMAWRYVMFYIRVKQAYLRKDLKIAFFTLPESRQDDYIRVANELTDNIAMFDRHVRTPRVYESYLYYEKTLESIDELVALLG